jgi:hypothetical protein
MIRSTRAFFNSILIQQFSGRGLPRPYTVWRLALLLLVFTVGALAHSLTMPMMEGSDESLHNTYMEFVRREGRLPSRENVRETSTRQASGQAPLTYWLAAQMANLAGLPSTDSDALLAHLYTIRNDWITPPDGWNRRDNLNHYFHGAGESAFGAPDVVATGRFLRLTSLIYGVLAVIGAYGAAREVFRRESWALTAAAVFAFMPTMVHLAGYFNNDISLIAFATLTIWATLRLLRLGATWRRLLLIGVLLALGGLSKVSALLVAPGVGLALLFDVYNRRESFARLVFNGVLVAAPVVALFGPWALWGWLHYRDPFGFLTHLNPYLSYTELLPLRRIISLMDEVYLSYWAKFGLAKVFLHPVTYTLFGGVLALALAGYLGWGWWRWRGGKTWVGADQRIRPHQGGAVINARTRPQNATMLDLRQGAYTDAPLRKDRSVSAGILGATGLQRALVLAVIGVTLLIGLVRWMQEIAVITGRLLYPAHIVYVIGLVGGLAALARLFPRVERTLQIGVVGFLCAAGVIYAPVALYQAYSPPPLLARTDLPPLQGEPIDYEGTLRLLGYQMDSPYLTDPLHTVTLCWEVLQPAAEPAAFSIKFVRGGVIVADRTSVFGLGHFDSSQWRAGDIFCDAVDVPLDDPDVIGDPLPDPATVYDLLVVVLNAETRAVDWDAALTDGTPVAFPFVGSVISPAGQMPGLPDGTPTDIRFADFARVEQVALSGEVRAGGDIALDVQWGVSGTTPDNWTQFIHLRGLSDSSGGSVSLADGAPRGGAYPTWAWQPGERLIDRWRLTLPDDLPPGDYALQIGFYRADSGERMPVMQDGTPTADRAATVLRVQVD